MQLHSQLARAMNRPSPALVMHRIWAEISGQEWVNYVAHLPPNDDIKHQCLSALGINHVHMDRHINDITIFPQITADAQLLCFMAMFEELKRHAVIIANGRGQYYIIIDFLADSVDMMHSGSLVHTPGIFLDLLSSQGILEVRYRCASSFPLAKLLIMAKSIILDYVDPDSRPDFLQIKYIGCLHGEEDMIDDCFDGKYGESFEACIGDNMIDIAKIIGDLCERQNRGILPNHYLRFSRINPQGHNNPRYLISLPRKHFRRLLDGPLTIGWPAFEP